MRRHGVLAISVLILFSCQLLFHEMSYSPVDNALLFLITGMTSGLAATLHRREAGNLTTAFLQNDADESAWQHAEPAVVG
jgi:hypothetical protein